MSYRGKRMLIKHAYLFILTVFVALYLPQVAQAEPEYTSPYTLRGEAIGTVLKHSSQVIVRSEMTRLDVRDWYPSNYNPQLKAEMNYQIQLQEGGDASLFTLLGSKQPIVTLNTSSLVPQVTTIPLEQSFYLNSFRGVNGQGNPFGKVIGQDQLQGYVMHHLPLQLGENTLSVQQSFDVHLDTSHFINRYGFFILNPQWQSNQQGLLKAWDYMVEILVPPAWIVKSPHMFERNGDVAIFRLMPSEATFQCTLIPPHNNRLYKLVKTSLWLVLGVTSLLSSLVAFGVGHATMRYPIAPRIGMLLVVVLGMAANWVLAETLANYLLQEASENHLSVTTIKQIQFQHWQQNFYGALLSGLVGCLVFLRTLEIPFFNVSEVEEPEVEEESEVEETPIPDEPAEPEEPAEVKYFTMTVGGDDDLDDEDV